MIDYSPVIAIKNSNVQSISQGYYSIYGSYYPTLEAAPAGIYIEIMTSGNRMVFHQQ